MKRKILVTGAAGFIGYHICKRLINNGDQVFGIDNLNSYYDINLKKARLEILSDLKKDWNFIKGDIENFEFLNEIFLKFKPEITIHLAAQAGVRYSIKNPSAYINSNLVGFSNILEICRAHKIRNLIYASSSSVYGGNRKIPFSESDPVNHPVSLYAATKRANELMAHSYSHLYDIPCTGLRFFTVYGPWGRPDMSPMIFTKAILSKKPLEIFNYGNMPRDFTYIDDVTEIIYRLVEKPATSNYNFKFDNPDPCSSWCKHRIFNVGNNKKINLLDFIKAIENELNLETKKIMLPFQDGDIKETFANCKLIYELINFKPSTNIKEGVKEFISWYLKFYNL